MSEIKLIANNRKALHDYFIEETYEAGIVLEGSEVKSLREGNCNLRDSFVMIKDGRAELIGMHISPYNKGGLFNPDARRNRALLLNKREILKLKSSVETKGYTIVPVKLYFRQALVKVEIGLAKGKNLYDKRQSIKEKQIKRETERDIKKLTE